MYPYIEILGRSYPTYGIFAAIGLVLSGLVVYFLVKNKGIFFEDIAMTGLYLAIGLFIGSHIMYGITNADKIVVLFQHISEYTFLDFIKTLFGVYMGGMVFYGGLIGGLVALVLADKFSKKKYFKGDIMFDPVAVVIPLFHTFGRIGCFFGGCCYGIECKVGFTFHGNTLYPEVNDVNRLPVQLIEAACNLILFLILLALYKKQKFPKRLLIVYFFMYPVVRFTLEFFRGDEIRGFLFGLSTSQIISILLFTFALVFTITDKLKKNKQVQ